MENENTASEILTDVKTLLDQLPVAPHGIHVIPQLSYNSYGSGMEGFNALKEAFNGLDLSKTLEFLDLDKKIKRQKRDVSQLEKDYTNLSTIIGTAKGGEEGTVANKILESLQKQIDELVLRRDGLLHEITIKEDKFDELTNENEKKLIIQNTDFLTRETKLKIEFKKKEEELDSYFKTKESELQLKLSKDIQDSNVKVKNAEIQANNNVKLIKQFSDFLQETNKNMILYTVVIIGLIIVAGVGVGFSVPSLLDIFKSYDTFIKTQGIFISSWNIINYSIGLFIVKLPWALCLSAVLTGMYKLLKGLLVTYEKINQDKRNMSAIYAISGNVALALNEYGIAVAEDVLVDEETGAEEPIIRVSKKDLHKKRENLRWNQIMNYFERMQQNKESLELPNDEDSRLKFATDIFEKSTVSLNKLIDKLPKQ